MSIIWKAYGIPCSFLCGGGLVAEPCLTLETPCIVASLTALSMGFPRQEYWNGLPFPSPGDFLIRGLNLCLLYYRQIFYH